MIKIFSIEQVDAETLLVTADVGASLPDGSHNEKHPIYVPVAAIGSRMVMYKLETTEEALHAILREHYSMNHPDIPTPESKQEAIALMPELGDVKIHGAAVAHKHLEANHDSIMAAHAARTGRRQ